MCFKYSWLWVVAVRPIHFLLGLSVLKLWEFSRQSPPYYVWSSASAFLRMAPGILVKLMNDLGVEGFAHPPATSRSCPKKWKNPHWWVSTRDSQLLCDLMESSLETYDELKQWGSLSFEIIKCDFRIPFGASFPFCMMALAYCLCQPCRVLKSQA